VTETSPVRHDGLSAATSSPPWLWLGALSLVLGTAVAIAPAPIATMSRGSAAATRVAIRVDCGAAAGCALAEQLSLDVWSEDRGPGLPLDVVVESTALAQLDAAHVAYEVLVPDIDKVAAEERARLQRVRANDGGDWFAEYKDYGAISAYLTQLAARAPELTKLETIGRSIEGRPIQALRIGGSSPAATPMMINGTQHAREWIAAMVTACVADRLVRGYATDPAIHDFVDRTELWVVPVVNPDGYQHSWGSNRYWRKNRRGTHGVDLNRNYSVAWGGDGSSNRERSEVYRGLTPFSEPESRALRDLALREQVAIHVDFHAYGQLLLYPWSYTRAPAADRALFGAVGDRMASAMAATHKTRYTLQSGAELYAAAGTMSDWMYGEAKALSFTVELRPSGNRGAGGFVLPPGQIKPTCDEGLAAVLALRSARP
jgi:carboxypeptidase T